MDSTTDVSTSPIINEDTSEQKNSSQMQQHLQEFPGHGNEEESAAATEEITSTMTSLSPTNPGDRLSDAVCEPECRFEKNGEIGKNEQNHDEVGVIFAKIIGDHTNEFCVGQQSLSLNTAAIAETSGDRSEPPRRFDLSSIWIALKNLELMRHYLRRQLLLWRSRPSSVEQDMELSRLQRVLIRFQGHVDFFSTQNRSTLEELASDRYSRSHRRHPARSAWIASTRWFSASEFTDYTSLWRSRRIRRKRLCRRMDRKWQVRSMVNNSSSSSYHAITAGIMAAPSKRQFAALGVGGVGGCCCCCGANAADSFCHSCHHRQRRRQQRHHHNHRIQSSLLVSTTAQASSVLVSPTDHQHLSPQPTTNPRGNAANTPWTNGQQQQTPNSTSTTPTMIMSHLHQQQQYSNPQIDYSIDLNPNNNKNQSPPDMFNNRQQTQLEQPQYIQNHGNIIHHLSTNTPIQQPPPQQQPVIISVPDAAYMEYDTQKIAITVREMLTANNIGQRIFARHVLGLSQGTVSELLSKPKPWNKLTEKGRESYKKMWNWANFPTGISQLKAFSPRKDQTTTVTSINCGSLANSASAIVAQNSLVQLVSSDSGVMNGILSKSVLENRHRSSIPGDATESPETMERIDQILIDAGRQIAQSKHELDLYKAAAAVRKTGLNCTNGLIETSTMAQQHQLSNSSPARSSSCTIIGGAGSISGGGGGGGGGSAGTTNCINNNNNHHHHHQHHHHHRRTTTTNCIGVINSSTNAPPPGLLQLQNSNRTMIRMEDSALQPQFIDTEHLVKGVKQYLSSHCISQRAFGEVVLGLSQGSVSDLLARPKPWNALTQKGREPFLRMKAFLDSPETYERLFARPSANQSNGGVYTGNTLKSEDPSNVKRNNNNKINNLHGSRTNTASTVSVDNITAVPAAAAAYAGGISRDNLAAAATTICGGGGNAQAAENSSSTAATASVEIDTEEISKKVKEILARYQIGQRLFGESVLNLSQGTVSELLSKPKPWKSLSAKGREPYHRMQVWLTTPGSIQKLVKSKLERSGNQPTAMQQSVLRNVKIDPKRRCVDLPPSQPPPATNPGGTISALWNQQANNNNDPNQNLSLSFPIDTSGSSNFGSRSYSVGPGTHCLADLFGENLTAILPSLQNLANAYSTVAVNNGSSSSSSNPNTSLQFGPSLFPDFMFNSAQNELFPSPSDLASSLPRALVPPDVADAGTAAAANEQTSGADGCAAHPVSSETPSESPLEPSTTNTTTTTTQNQDLTGRRKRTEPKKIFRASRLYDWQEQENQQLTQTPPTNNDNEDPDSTGQTPQQTSPDSTHKSAAESMESSKRPTSSSSAAATAAATTTKHHHHQPHHDSTTTTLESGEDGGGENGEHAHDS